MSRQVLMRWSMSSVQKRVLLVVTQIDTQALPDSARTIANSLIGLVAEEPVFALHLMTHAAAQGR